MSEQAGSIDFPQQSPPWEVTFVLPPSLNAAAGVQAWLHLMGADLPMLTAPSAGNNDADAAKHWVALVLRMARLLLQALRLPVFEVPQVLFCREAVDAGGRYMIRFILSAPAPANRSRTVCSDVLKSAFGLAKWTCTADVNNAKHREHFYEVIQRSVLQPHAAVIPAGKSTLEVLSAAYRKGIPYCLLAGDVYQLGWGYRLKRMDRSSTDRDTVTGCNWSQNKFLTAGVLSAVGLPTPKHHLVQTASAARDAAQKIGYPLVVKPVDLGHGEGVAVDVGADTLNEAFDDAYKRSPKKQVLVEQLVAGVCHRLFVSAGRLLYAVRRLPIGVYADGQRAVAELVNTACEQQVCCRPGSYQGSSRWMT